MLEVYEKINLHSKIVILIPPGRYVPEIGKRHLHSKIIILILSLVNFTIITKNYLHSKIVILIHYYPLRRRVS